jgi:DnaJ-class molecular chaperone
MSNKEKDFYKILNVEKNATEDEIRKSYKKLALQYHPDKNNGSDERFKEIAEAYSVLSDKDKKAQYDNFGGGMNGFSSDMFDFGESGIDPFSTFNNIFQQHMSNFMNMRYENDIDIDDLIGGSHGGKGSPFGNIRVKIHTFKKGNFIFDDKDENEGYNSNGFSNKSKESKNIFKEGLSSIFENIFSAKSSNKFNEFNEFSEIKKEKLNKTESQSSNIIYSKPDPIVYDIKVSFEDIYNKVKKTITIKRNKLLKNGGVCVDESECEYIKKIKKINIPIYGKEVFLENMGNEELNYKYRGDVIINIYNKKNKNFRRVNDYDMLTFKNITLSELYSAFTYDIILPHGEVLMIQSENMIGRKDVLIQRVMNKGLPYQDDDGNDMNGNLYIIYKIVLPNTIDELKEINILDNKETVDINYIIAYNCSFDEIFNE